MQTENRQDENYRAAHGTSLARLIPAYLDVVGIACFAVWQNAQMRFFFPSSAQMVISPLFIFNAAAVLLVVLCYVSYRCDSARALSTSWFVGLAIVGTVAGSFASGLVARSLLPLGGIYIASALSGFSVAALSYAWACRMVRVSSQQAFTTVITASLFASVIELFGMNINPVLIPAFLLAAGVGTCICFAKRPMPPQDSELIFRPVQVRDYLLIAAGLIVLSGALGLVSGSMANVSSEDMMRAFNQYLSGIGVALSLICLVVVALLRDRLDWTLFLRLMPSFMLIVVLMNILDPAHTDAWLALTLTGWGAVRVLVFLFIIEVSRKRIVSLALLYPFAWALLFGGHAAGICIAQVFLPGDIDTPMFTSMVVAVAIIITCSSMLILGNRLVLGLMAENSVAWGAADTQLETSRINAAEGSELFADISEEETTIVAAPDSMTSPVVSSAISATRIVVPKETSSTATSNSAEPYASATASTSAAFNAAASDTTTEPYATTSNTTVSSTASPFEERCHAIATSHHLSTREEEVMVLLARGNTRASIAKKLFISENTVRAHAKSIYAKLYIHSKQQLINLVDE